MKIKESDEAYCQSYLKKDREQKEAQRSASKAEMSKSQLEEHRVKERQRVREYRLKKKMESQPKGTCSPLTSTPYSTTQARGKAIKRARLALPLSPRKRQCVVRSLVGLQMNASPLSTSKGHGTLIVKKQSSLSMLFTTALILPGRLLGHHNQGNEWRWKKNQKN